MRISDWSSDVCSSDLSRSVDDDLGDVGASESPQDPLGRRQAPDARTRRVHVQDLSTGASGRWPLNGWLALCSYDPAALRLNDRRDVHDRISVRSEEHTSELQSLMRISYAVFCLKKKKKNNIKIKQKK